MGNMRVCAHARVCGRQSREMGDKELGCNSEGLWRWPGFGGMGVLDSKGLGGDLGRTGG